MSNCHTVIIILILFSFKGNPSVSTSTGRTSICLLGFIIQLKKVITQLENTINLQNIMRVFLIFHDPMHPLSSSSHMHFLKQYCQYEDPLKLVRSRCSRAQISVFVLGRCSPYPFKKVDCIYKAS